MALDIADRLQKHDVQILRTDQYRTYNLLEKKFEDNPHIGLDVGQMLIVGLNLNHIEGVFLQYLTQFGVNLAKFAVKKKRDGSVIFDCKFKETRHVLS